MICTFEIGEAEYDVEFDYRPGTPDTRDEPGDGPEVDIEDEVIVTQEGKQKKMKYDEFILVYAEDHGLTAEKAEDEIFYKLCQSGEDYWADRFDEVD